LHFIHTSYFVNLLQLQLARRKHYKLQYYCNYNNNNLTYNDFFVILYYTHSYIIRHFNIGTLSNNFVFNILNRYDQWLNNKYVIENTLHSTECEPLENV